jgi:hypothetical protein
VGLVWDKCGIVWDKSLPSYFTANNEKPQIQADERGRVWMFVID